MKILVCGGRRFTDRAFIFDCLEQFGLQNDVSHVIHGGCSGVDKRAGEWADETGRQQVIVPANWRAYGVTAGPVRNKAMIDLKPDLVIAFPGGKGTSNMKSIARAANVQVIEITPPFKESA